MKDESKPSSEKTPDSRWVAVERTGRGLLGGSFIVGPFALIFGYSSLDFVPYLALASFFTLCYAIAFLKWRKQGFLFVKAVALDTLLTYAFAGIVGVIGGIISALGGPAFSYRGDIMGVFVFLGFWILEARRRRAAGRTQ